MRTPREQGDRGELSAIVWLAGQGYPVFKPLFHSPHYDLVADRGSKLVRVEVKTTTLFRKADGKSRSVLAAATKAGIV
jgi:Holliday junction resolvase-like predicted endonuclease